MDLGDSRLTLEIVMSLACSVCCKFGASFHVRNDAGVRIRICQSCNRLLHEMFEVPYNDIIDRAFKSRTISDLDLLYRTYNRETA